LALEQLERVEAEFGLWNFEGFLEDGGGFVLYEEEVSVGFVLADLLNDAKVVDGGEEVAPREVGDGLEGHIRGGQGVAKFIDFRGTGGEVSGPFIPEPPGEVYSGRRPGGVSAEFDYRRGAGFVLTSFVLLRTGGSASTVGLAKTEESKDLSA
jgi:hypothetical protein